MGCQILQYNKQTMLSEWRIKLVFNLRGIQVPAGITEEVHFAVYASNPTAPSHSRSRALEELMEDGPADGSATVVALLCTGSPLLEGCLVGLNHTNNQQSEFEDPLCI